MKAPFPSQHWHLSLPSGCSICIIQDRDHVFQQYTQLQERKCEWRRQPTIPAIQQLCYGVNCVPQKTILELALEPLFGKRFIAHDSVKMKPHWDWMGPNPLWLLSLWVKKIWTHTHTHTCSGRIPDEHEFWVGDNVSTNQETPKMGRGLKQILSLSLSWRNQPWPHLELRLLFPCDD
jgi:hypothetical protein